jgi:hypothetical protein
MKKVKNIPTYYTFPGTKIFRDTTALPFADGGPLHDRNINGKLLNSTYAPQLGNMFREGGPFRDDIGAFDYAKSIYASQLGDYYKTGGMLKRADGSYSPRGLWDNIRANAGSGKAPTKAMLAQEKKINKQYKEGGPVKIQTDNAPYNTAGPTNELPDNDYSLYIMKMKQEALKGNLAAQRMLSANPEIYNFTGEEYISGQPAGVPAGEVGTHFMSSMDNYAVPFIQQGDNGQLYFNEDANPENKESIQFDNSEDADEFARNYKKVAPMMKSFRTGGQFPRPYSLPEDSFKQGGRNLHNSVYASSNAQYPAIYNFGGTLKNNLATRQQMYMPLDHITRNGGSILSMSNTPEMSGEGKDLTVPDNAYYYANGGAMGKPWLNNLYPDGGGLFQRWRNKNAVEETPVQQLPEMTVYGNTESAAQQKSLMLKLEEMKRAFNTMRQNSGYGAGELDVQQKGSIGGLKHNIQIYKKALEEQKAISAKAQTALNVLKKHDSENWKDKTVRDIIENPQALNSLRELYSKDKISEGTFRDFYNNFGKWNDTKAAQGSGPDAAYSGKEAREEWGKSEHWKDFTDAVNTVATAIPLIGAAGALVNPGSLSALLSNPYVSGGMNAYGLYNLPHGINQTYNDFSKGNYGAGIFNGLMTAADALPIAGGVRYAKNLLPGIKNVRLGHANVSDLIKPADLMQLRKEYAQVKINNNKFDSPTMGSYYGDTRDIEQFAYWPTKKITDPITKIEIEKPLENAFMRTKLGGTKASVADKRIDNLTSEGLWTSYITNPDGTLKSKEETLQILSDLHAEDALLKTEKQNVLGKIKAGYKNKEFIGRIPLIEARQKSIYKLINDAAAFHAPTESVPRPEEFNAAIKKVLNKGINGKKIKLSQQDTDMLRYISNHHNEYFSNPEIKATVDKIFTEYPHIKEIKESKPFSSQAEYIFPVGKNPTKISHDEFLKSMETHDERAFLNNYLRRHPNKKYSPFVLATEANLMRSNLLKNPAIGTGNIAYHALPYTNQETIPYFGEPAEQIPVSPSILPNPWAASKQNIFGLKAGGPMYLNNNKKFPTFTNRFIK